MKVLSVVFLFAIILAACGTPPATVDTSAIATSAVQTAFAQQTQDAPTAAPTDTDVPEPTATEEPVATSTPAPSLDEVRQKLLDAVNTDLSRFEDVESISLVRFNEGALEIELKTIWASQDSQPDVSWTIVQAFADGFHGYDKENLELVAGGPFVMSLTTFSTDGDYRYQSLTDWDTLQKLASNSISYDEWVAASGAGFK